MHRVDEQGTSQNPASPPPDAPSAGAAAGETRRPELHGLGDAATMYRASLAATQSGHSGEAPSDDAPAREHRPAQATAASSAVFGSRLGSAFQKKLSSAKQTVAGRLHLGSGKAEERRPLMDEVETGRKPGTSQSAAAAAPIANPSRQTTRGMAEKAFEKALANVKKIDGSDSTELSRSILKTLMPPAKDCASQGPAEADKKSTLGRLAQLSEKRPPLARLLKQLNRIEDPGIRSATLAAVAEDWFSNRPADLDRAASEFSQFSNFFDKLEPARNEPDQLGRLKAVRSLTQTYVSIANGRLNGGDREEGGNKHRIMEIGSHLEFIYDTIKIRGGDSPSLRTECARIAGVLCDASSGNKSIGDDFLLENAEKFLPGTTPHGRQTGTNVEQFQAHKLENLRARIENEKSLKGQAFIEGYPFDEGRDAFFNAIGKVALSPRGDDEKLRQHVFEDLLPAAKSCKPYYSIFPLGDSLREMSHRFEDAGERNAAMVQFINDWFRERSSDDTRAMVDLEQITQRFQAVFDALERKDPALVGRLKLACLGAVAKSVVENTKWRANADDELKQNYDDRVSALCDAVAKAFDAVDKLLPPGVTAEYRENLARELIAKGQEHPLEMGKCALDLASRLLTYKTTRLSNSFFRSISVEGKKLIDGFKEAEQQARASEGSDAPGRSSWIEREALSFREKTGYLPPVR